MNMNQIVRQTHRCNQGGHAPHKYLAQSFCALSSVPNKILLLA